MNSFNPVKKFVETLPNANLQWIEQCGHVPHLEKPDETAAAISSFLVSEVAPQTSTSEDGQSTYIVGAGVVGAIATATTIANMLSQ